MNNFQLPLFFVLISAMVTENLIFARASGIDEIIGNAKTNKQIITYSTLLFFITFPSVALAYPIKNIWMTPQNWTIFRGMIIATVVVVCYFIMKYLIKATGLNEKFSINDDVVLFISFNCSNISRISAMSSFILPRPSNIVSNVFFIIITKLCILVNIDSVILLNSFL